MQTECKLGQNPHSDPTSTLGDIITCADASPTLYVVIIGDWNSNVSYPSIFGREMLNFCTEFNFIISDIEVLGITSDAFTFLSEAHGNTSWLDHCISRCTTVLNLSR